MADNIPDIGGTPDAMAIPNARGNATKDTLTAARRSLCQFSINPFMPFFGIISTNRFLKLSSYCCKCIYRMFY